MALILDFTKALVPVNWRQTPSGWISGNCPVCVLNGHSPDTRGRGGFLFTDEKFQYHCFNCNFNAGWNPESRSLSDHTQKLFKAFGAYESDIQRLKLQILEERDLATVLSMQKAKDEPVVINWQEIELPKGAKPISEYTEVTPELEKVIEYMVSRGLDPMDDRFYYSPAISPARMKNRFIMVFKYKGKIVGYTARWSGNPPSKEVPKYFTKQPKKNFVYGLDDQVWNKKFVILTEGQLDAYYTDGIAIGSNNINDSQANIIDSLGKKVILVPDMDPSAVKMKKTTKGYEVDEYSNLTVNMAINRDWYVSFPEWNDCKDVGDAVEKYGRLFTVKSILKNATNNPTKIQVLAKKYCK